MKKRPRKTRGALVAAESSPLYMARYVVDASVAVKWFLEETGSDLAGLLAERASAGECSLIAPTLLRVEVAGALMKASRSSVEGMVDNLNRLEAMPIVWEPVSNALTIAATRLGMARKLRAADATYVATAELERAVLVTDDREVVQRLRGTGLAILLSALR